MGPGFPVSGNVAQICVYVVHSVCSKLSLKMSVVDVLGFK